MKWGVMRYLMVFTLLATCGCAFFACSGGTNETANAPAVRPPSWDDQSSKDWLYRMQYKGHMRHMWIGANRIVTAGAGDKQPNWDEIWAGAADIESRSELMLRYWKGMRDHAENGLMAVEDGDRIGADDAVRKVGLNCDGCHMATWSPAYLHITHGTLDAWVAGKNAPMDMLESDDEPPPEWPNRRVMAELWKQWQVAQLGVQDWKKERIVEGLKPILAEAATRTTHWQSIHDNAVKLKQLAENKKREGMQAAYNAMRATCLACHAAQAGPERPIQSPLPWN